MFNLRFKRPYFALFKIEHTLEPVVAGSGSSTLGWDIFTKLNETIQVEQVEIFSTRTVTIDFVFSIYGYPRDIHIMVCSCSTGIKKIYKNI